MGDDAADIETCWKARHPPQCNTDTSNEDDRNACWNAQDCSHVWGQLQVDCWAERSPQQCFEIDQEEMGLTTGKTRGACWADKNCGELDDDLKKDCWSWKNCLHIFDDDDLQDDCWAHHKCADEKDEEAKTACQESQ